MIERRESEDITAFTMRRIRNEIIETCAMTADKEADGCLTDDGEAAVRYVAILIRAMKEE